MCKTVSGVFIEYIPHGSIAIWNPCGLISFTPMWSDIILDFSKVWLHKGHNIALAVHWQALKCPVQWYQGSRHAMNSLQHILQQAWCCCTFLVGWKPGCSMGGSQGTVMDKLCLASKHLYHPTSSSSNLVPPYQLPPQLPPPPSPP